MKKAKLGTGKRFAEGVKKIEKKEGYSKERASAIMASAGRKKYGSAKMAKMAAKNRVK